MKKLRYMKNGMLSLLAIASMVCYPLTAHAASVGEVTNHGSIGAVDIQLTYDVPEGETTAIVPGQTVSLESTILNVAEPAWIRAKIEYPITAKEDVLANLEDFEMVPLDDGLVTFANDEWKKIGEYYYMTNPVDMGESKAFTSSITFPDSWDNQLAESGFGISITAEAVQETHFEPDFEGEDPWHGVVIESYDSTNYKPKASGNERFYVTYEGGAEGMVTVGDDFFVNWETMMPGDTFTGEVSIRNNMSIPVRMYFEMEKATCGNEEDEAVLEQIGLKVWHGDDVLYDGKLSDGLEEALLAEYPSGMAKKLTYELSIPETVDNRFAEAAFRSVWRFRAEEVPPEIVRTGESVAFVVVTLGLAIVLLVSFTLWRKVKKKTRGEGEER